MDACKVQQQLNEVLPTVLLALTYCIPWIFCSTAEFVNFSDADEYIVAPELVNDGRVPMRQASTTSSDDPCSQASDWPSLDAHMKRVICPGCLLLCTYLIEISTNTDLLGRGADHGFI